MEISMNVLLLLDPCLLVFEVANEIGIKGAIIGRTNYLSTLHPCLFYTWQDLRNRKREMEKPRDCGRAMLGAVAPCIFASSFVLVCSNIWLLLSIITTTLHSQWKRYLVVWQWSSSIFLSEWVLPLVFATWNGLTTPRVFSYSYLFLFEDFLPSSFVLFFSSIKVSFSIQRKKT